MISDTCGIKISAATLAKLIAKKAKKMELFTESVKDLPSDEQTAVKHLDETGLRVAGKTRWIHVLCSTFLSYLRLGASRDDVPEYLLGKAVHDCFSSNWTLEGVYTHRTKSMLASQKEIVADSFISFHSFSQSITF